MGNMTTTVKSSGDSTAVDTAIKAIDENKYVETLEIDGKAIIVSRTNALGFTVEPTATETTTDATVTSVKTLTLTDEKVYHITISVKARERDGSDRNLYNLEGLFYRQGGGAVQQGATTSITTIESEALCACVFDTNGNDVRVRVTGVAAETWDWSCVMTFSIAGSLA